MSDEKKDIRIAQFMPFDSLKGFKEALKEKEEIYVEEIELSQDIAEEINQTLNNVKVFDQVEIVYYINQKYKKIRGIVTKIKYDLGYLQIVKEKVKFESIYSINILTDMLK